MVILLKGEKKAVFSRFLLRKRSCLSRSSRGLSHNEQFSFSGKAVGGRRTREKRLLVKHLTSTDYSTGFHGDLNLALSKILTDNEWFGDENKEKRKVIREQTKQTKTSLKDSIRSAKVKKNRSVKPYQSERTPMMTILKS